MSNILTCRSTTVLSDTNNPWLLHKGAFVPVCKNKLPNTPLLEPRIQPHNTTTCPPPGFKFGGISGLLRGFILGQKLKLQEVFALLSQSHLQSFPWIPTRFSKVSFRQTGPNCGNWQRMNKDYSFHFFRLRGGGCSKEGLRCVAKAKPWGFYLIYVGDVFFRGRKYPCPQKSLKWLLSLKAFRR